MEKKKQVQIFDTTLRDGQQCPGAAMSFEDNLRYAELASELRIDVLEAGFPSASSLDFDIVQKIAEEISPREDSPIITGLCQLREEQVDKTIEALLPALQVKKARLHTYVPVDPELMSASLGERAEDKSGIREDVHRFIKKAVDTGLEVEFSPEGYSRMGENFDFVTDLIRAAVEAGARVINCPDTIGGAAQYQGDDYFVHHMNAHAEIIRNEYPEREVIWSVHCHNDFGLAIENSLNGVFKGPATQIEGCINGIGERAGNVSLEQCIMLLKHFGDTAVPGKRFYTGIETKKLQEISDFVSAKMLPRQPHTPIVGLNAAKHSAGGHTNAILRNPLAYQPFNPTEVGKEISFLFGPLSGGNHAKSIIERLGYSCEDSEKSEIAQSIKDYYKDRRKGITDEELLEGYFEYRKPIAIESFDYSRNAKRSEISLEGKFFSKEGTIRSVHEGRDSALAALQNALDEQMPGLSIQSHKSESEGQGINATSISTILLKDERDNFFEGKGRDQDIEISAMKALIDAVNRVYVERHYRTR